MSVSVWSEAERQGRSLKTQSTPLPSGTRASLGKGRTATAALTGDQPLRGRDLGADGLAGGREASPDESEEATAQRAPQASPGGPGGDAAGVPGHPNLCPRGARTLGQCLGSSWAPTFKGHTDRY